MVDIATFNYASVIFLQFYLERLWSRYIVDSKESSITFLNSSDNNPPNDTSTLIPIAIDQALILFAICSLALSKNTAVPVENLGESGKQAADVAFQRNEHWILGCSYVLRDRNIRYCSSNLGVVDKSCCRSAIRFGSEDLWMTPISWENTDFVVGIVVLAFALTGETATRKDASTRNFVSN